ncbi:MAG TPA: glycosyl hydrolase 108 family protein [Rhizomicrobium sp.]|nr:glycosyl hydrolase 108 family protein [Rhizomicrobium sp.]
MGVALLLMSASAALARPLPGYPAVPRAASTSPVAALAVRNSVAGDGSLLTLRPFKDGFIREIRFPDGTTARTVFKLFNRGLGTVTEEGDGDGVSGLFALDGKTIRIVYDDGRSEYVVIGADGDVSIATTDQHGTTACMAWVSPGRDGTDFFPRGSGQESCPRDLPSNLAAVPDNASWNAFDRFYASFVALHEGGYVGDDGNGSPANYGINQGANPDIDVLSLDKPAAEQILYQRYWLASGADRLPSPLAMVHGDTAISMGVKTANEMLAQSGGDPNTYLELRDERYRAIAAADPKKASYLSLWLARTDDLRAMLEEGEGADDRREYRRSGFGAGF